MYLNQGAKDPLQDSKKTELDSHARRLLPTANWSHTNIGFVASVQTDPNSTPTMGNTSQSIHFSDGSNENNSPPSVTTVGNDPLFPSVTDDISSVPENANPHSSSKSSSSNRRDVAATNVATTNCIDDDASTIDNQLQLSAQSLVHSLAMTMK